MDEIDARLCGMLIVNSRTSYRELADSLGISLQAVYRRIQIMQASGVIKGFHTMLSLGYNRGVVIYVMGTSESRSMDQTVEALSKNDATHVVLVSGRSYLTIGAVVQSVNDADPYIEWVRKTALLTDISIGFTSVMQTKAANIGPGIGSGELTQLDFRIIQAMRRDSRKPVEVIAAELNLSAATVRRHLNKMIESGAIQNTIEWHPSMAGVIMTQLHVMLHPGVDRFTFGAELLEQLGPRLLWFVTFSNLPDFIYASTWGSTMHQVDEVVATIEKDERVIKVVPNVIHREYSFEYWESKLVDEGAKGRLPKKE